MANEFSKEERVAFEDILEGFQDALVLSKNVAVYNTDQSMMERAGNVIWRPEPYIAQSFDGTDQTLNFKDSTQLSVPATIGFNKSVPWVMTATEMRDAIQENRLGDAAKQKLASDINRAVMDVAALQGSLVVARGAAATGFVDVAAIEAVMNEQGIPDYDRYLALSTRDYNGMAADLAARQYMPGKPTTAYERAYVGRIASFDTFKLDYAVRLLAAAAGGGITISTLAGGGNVYVPEATSVAATGERANVDNRFQTVTFSSNVGMVAGDCFTIATVESVHHITKQPTGVLKTFRIISVGAANTCVICPPIISGQGGTDAELQYQNCFV
ncbi:MAG TPA: P22 phage major capsid protein family protein, partial [Dissulfurispiraceae bacterium]|nr:P22 phage major capsid protein family protein [Dissulfurispiraceae bacterium]